MSQWSGPSQDWYELSKLPPGDPRRRELEEQLSVFPAAERAYWIQLFAESDRLYAEAAGRGLDSAFEEKLLGIPDAPLQLPLARRLLSEPVGWMHFAAAILLLLGIFAVVQWAMQPRKYHALPQLDQQLADAISQMAVSHESTPMQVQSSDVATVANALMQQKLPFTPMVLKPTAPLNLQGGGVFNYQSAPVAFTRWSGNGVNYTLYQFDPHSLGVPRQFPKKIDTVASSQRVVLWAGMNGSCTWALVLDNPKATDQFSDTYTY